MPHSQINGRRIYYELHGSGQGLVLLHHGFGSAALWKQVWPSLVDADYQVLLYDRRGYGRSEPGEDFADFYVSDDFRPASVAELAALLEKLQLGPVHLVGQCEGGVIAMDFSRAFPQQVQSLVMASVQGFSFKSMVEFNREKFPKSFAELEPELQEKFRYWHGRKRAEPLYEMARTRGGAYGSDIFDLRPLLCEVECPTLVLYPDRSALFSVEQAVGMYRALPKGELAVMPYCGHNTYEYRPSEYLRLVLDFLARQEAKAGLGGDAADKQDPSQMTCAG